MKLHVFVGPVTGANSYVLECPEKTLILIDAADHVTEWLERKFPDSTVTHLLITHAHFDHVMDAQALRERYGCTIIAGIPFNREATLIEGVRKRWGMDIPFTEYTVDEILPAEDSSAEWGGFEWKVVHVPGHSDDSVVYILPEQGVAFTGDTIFAGAIGRTDLPGGDMKKLLQNLRRGVLSLPPETKLLPGHGAETTVKREDLCNPFL